MSSSNSPIPVNVITGALGAGKTSVIARLLADKPVDESWLVILNEFTDTGIDALTLAAAARGAYDVRMIPGGCLCCTGEEDFRRQLSGVLSLPSERWPARILVEPSGIGHPGAIIEELRLFARSGAIELCSTVALLDAQRGVESGLDDVMRAQVDAADVVVLSKAELVDAAAREKFMQWALALFPAKRFVGCSRCGDLPAQALAPPKAAFNFQLPLRPLAHQYALTAKQLPDAHEHAPQLVARQLRLGNADVLATAQQLLGRSACGWRVPGEVLFDLSQLQSILMQEQLWHGVERFKAVLRTSVEGWHLLQRWGRQYAIETCNWRQDSRIEVQLAEGATTDWLAWDERWQIMSSPCPVG
ncbi:MAG: GTP-binding protein [Steroidobacteraceae bacterium]